MKKIEIDLLNLIAILLIVGAIILFSFYYFYYSQVDCLYNPVTYANINNKSYAWDYVVPINIGK